MAFAFRAIGLMKKFGETTALAGADFSARPGEVLAVLGPNGAGKTTAVRILATLLRPDGGRAEVAGFDVVRQPAQVRQRIGLTGQYASVDEDLTGMENLVLIGRLLDLPAARARQRASDLLERFGLTEVAGRRAGGYSGGMRRRLDLAASLVGRPSVVFLDEPTTGLDPGRREDVWRMIRSMTRDGGAVLLTTQYLEEADALADRISVLDHGRVIAAGTPAELKRLVGGQTVAVRPADPAHLEPAAGILAEVAGHPPVRSGDLLTVPVAAEAMFTALVNRLADARIPAAELALRLPSLDEVFVTLTGRHTDDHEQEDPA